jgi:hypothetical protein
MRVIEVTQFGGPELSVPSDAADPVTARQVEESVAPRHPDPEQFGS